MLINNDFAKFWFAQVFAQLAAKGIVLVLPLMAVVSFDATPGQVGFLNAAQFFPVFVVTLFAGAWLDSRPRRPSMIAAYLGGAMLCSVIPLASPGGTPHVNVLFAVAFGLGCLIAFSDVCYQVYVPHLVSRNQLVSANSRLEGTHALAMVAAPGLGGVLLGQFGGSAALTAAMIAYIVAALAVLTIRARERGLGRSPEGPGMLTRIAEGMRFTAGMPLLRALTLQGAWFNLFEQAVLTLYLLYAVRTLGFSAQLVGLTVSLGAIGVVVGSLAAKFAESRFRTSRVLIAGMGVASATPIVLPFVSGPAPVAVALVVAVFSIYGFGLTVFNVFGISLRQRVTPDGMLGRVSATYRFLAFGAIGVGGITGGLLGDLLGLRAGFVVATAALVIGWLVFARVLPRALALAEAGETAPAPTTARAGR